MSIDKVYIFTINRARERMLMCLGGLFSMGVPTDKIEIFYGADFDDYDDINDLCSAAIVDGFPNFEEVNKDESAKWAFRCVAQYWSYLHLWRRIKENDEIAIVIHDDILLSMKFERYQHIIGHLNHFDKDWRLLNLLSYTSLKEWNREGFGNFNHMIFKGITNHNYDQAIIINSRFVDWIMASPYVVGDYMGLDTFFVEIESNPRLNNFKDLEGIWTLPEEISVSHIPHTTSMTTHAEGYVDFDGFKGFDHLGIYRMAV